MIKPFWPVLLALAVGVAPFSAAHGADRNRREHEAAREALARGEIMPLARILAIVAKVAPGDILAIELEYRRSRPVYEVRVLDAGGRVREIDIDARDGAVIRDGED
jgi:uncharacterized membrane protein YkoI